MALLPKRRIWSRHLLEYDRYANFYMWPGSYWNSLNSRSLAQDVQVGIASEQAWTGCAPSFDSWIISVLIEELEPLCVPPSVLLRGPVVGMSTIPTGKVVMIFRFSDLLWLPLFFFLNNATKNLLTASNFSQLAPAPLSSSQHRPGKPLTPPSSSGVFQHGT